MVGTDSSTQNETKEIQQYINARYLSASEASWRIFQFELQNRSPGIQKLAVHLPHMESVVYKVGHAVHTTEKAKNTTLTAWFQKNKEDPEARSILYLHFPEHYTWDQTSSSWKSRKKGNMIGRVYRANPTGGKRFYLRLLLHHLLGCTSFEALRTLDDGFECNTFKDAAARRGFLQDDLEWSECLEEAYSYASPFQIRSLFVIILVFCEPFNHVALWEKF
ncbi:unnamed protein product [Mytilus coruscus]|uniref:Uncharacterized protein n=1 Tax=Mytilus coruscus TaxID=42192 RepID=A0A6J8E5Z9_MYTCO|nr:unnamed protein product [Mytilus coruscus]